jgi:hypothetical protein
MYNQMLLLEMRKLPRGLDGVVFPPLRACSVTSQLPASLKFTAEHHRTPELRGAKSEKLDKSHVQNAEHLFWEFSDR